MQTVVGQQGSYTLDPENVRLGGRATVHSAKGPDGQVAIKWAKLGAEHDLERERDTLASLPPASDGWVVQLLDWGVHQDRPFIVLQWHPHSLSTWVRTAPSLPDRLRALIQAAQAVSALHEQGGPGHETIHRDIKPANLLMKTAPYWGVVLADLGGTRTQQQLSSVTNTGLLTQGFGPPEQNLPTLQRQDSSWDVHGIAATIYWTLVGNSPQAKDNIYAAFTKETRQLLRLRDRQPTDGQGTREWERLRAQPPSVFLDFSALEALNTADREDLTRVLKLALPPHAHPLISVLTTELLRALEPNPNRRERDPRRLEVVLRRLLEEGFGEVAVAGSAAALSSAPIHTLPATTVPAATAPPAPKRSRRAGWLLAFGLAIVGGLSLWATPWTQAREPTQRADEASSSSAAPDRESSLEEVDHITLAAAAEPPDEQPPLLTREPSSDPAVRQTTPEKKTDSQRETTPGKQASFKAETAASPTEALVPCVLLIDGSSYYRVGADYREALDAGDSHITVADRSFNVTVAAREDHWTVQLPRLPVRRCAPGASITTLITQDGTLRFDASRPPD